MGSWTNTADVLVAGEIRLHCGLSAHFPPD